MRRILNLNQPGARLVKIIVLLVGAIPALLYSISLFLTKESIISFLLTAIKVSFAAGIFVCIALLTLIVAEQIQDHYIDVQYQKNRNQKLPLADGNYECQYCGNRNVKENDNTCAVCGRELR